MYRQQRVLLYVLPVIFIFSGYAFPIGAMFYWLTSNVWTLVQQFLVIRNMPTPGSEAALAREARLAKRNRDKMSDDAAALGRVSDGFGEVLRDEQAQDDGERRRWRACALERAERLLVGLLLGLRAARVADGHLALLVRRGWLLDAEPVGPGRRLAVLGQHERAEQLHGVGVELRLPARERRA